MNTQIIIGVVAVIVLIIIVFVLVKKEKYTLDGMGLVPSSGKGTPYTASSYLTADSSGNISTTTSGQFNNVDVEGKIYLQGYPGNVGDVLVSNGSSYPPVWTPGVGLSDFVGKNQKIDDNGYQIFPGGLIIQWGFKPLGWGSAKEVVTFPIEFPKKCFSVSISVNNADAVGGSENNVVLVTTVTKKGFGLGARYTNDVYWMAIGN